MRYIYSEDGVNAIGGLRTKLPNELINADKATRMAVGWYDFVPTPHELAEDEICICNGFKREGDHFVGIYEIIKVEPDPEAV